MSVSRCQFFRTVSLWALEVSLLEINFVTIPLTILGRGSIYASYCLLEKEALSNKIEKSTRVAVLPAISLFTFFPWSLWKPQFPPSTVPNWMWDLGSDTAPRPPCEQAFSVAIFAMAFFTSQMCHQRKKIPPVLINQSRPNSRPYMGGAFWTCETT